LDLPFIAFFAGAKGVQDQLGGYINLAMLLAGFCSLFLQDNCQRFYLYLLLVFSPRLSVDFGCAERHGAKGLSSDQLNRHGYHYKYGNFTL